jgi:hypothetical protein
VIQNRYWHRLPSEVTVGALTRLTWGRQDELSPASTTVALMLYVALHFMAQSCTVTDSLGIQTLERIADATYDELMHATSVKSRTLVSQGLARLQALGLITRVGSHQKRRYRLTDSQPGWFKLPCQAILRAGVIVPFSNLTLRSRHELHALKVYLYLAARRDNYKTYSMASYENISQNTGVPERYMRKALVILTGCGLLEDIRRERDQLGETAAFGPNVYYLRGHNQLFQSSTPGASVTPETTPTSPPSPHRSLAEQL